MPAEAAKRFVQWAGGEKARILVVAWSSEDPQGCLADAKRDFYPATVEMAEPNPASPAFAAQLARASGVWFSGGDQARHMNALTSNGGAPLEAVRRRHREGIAFGGTSAGTAVMSRIMITGNGDFSVIDANKVETSEGLGLLDGVIVDQHFIKRARENRLFGLMLKYRDQMGLGVDENTAAVIEDGRVEVFGTGAVMIVHPQAGAEEALSLELVRPGQAYDLKSKTRIKSHAP